MAGSEWVAAGGTLVSVLAAAGVGVYLAKPNASKLKAETSKLDSEVLTISADTRVSTDIAELITALRTELDVYRRRAREAEKQADELDRENLVLRRGLVLEREYADDLRRVLDTRPHSPSPDERHSSQDTGTRPDL